MQKEVFLHFQLQPLKFIHYNIYYIVSKNRKNPFWGRGIFSYFLYIKTSWGKIYGINITKNCENFVTLLGKIYLFKNFNFVS